MMSTVDAVLHRKGDQAKRGSRLLDLQLVNKRINGNEPSDRNEIFPHTLSKKQVWQERR